VLRRPAKLTQENAGLCPALSRTRSGSSIPLRKQTGEGEREGTCSTHPKPPNTQPLAAGQAITELQAIVLKGEHLLILRACCNPRQRGRRKQFSNHELLEMRPLFNLPVFQRQRKPGEV
jgi:hypothetical protein